MEGEVGQSGDDDGQYLHDVKDDGVGGRRSSVHSDEDEGERGEEFEGADAALRRGNGGREVGESHGEDYSACEGQKPADLGLQVESDGDEEVHNRFDDPDGEGEGEDSGEASGAVEALEASDESGGERPDECLGSSGERAGGEGAQTEERPGPEGGRHYEGGRGGERSQDDGNDDPEGEARGLAQAVG